MAKKVPKKTDKIPIIMNKKLISKKTVDIAKTHLIKKTNKESLGITENIIVEANGDPSYTSGDQKWNGAAATLKNSVKVTKSTPIRIKTFNESNSENESKANNQFKMLKFRVPKQPYNKAAPNKKTPEMNDPEIKYFKPASVENEESLLKLAKT